MSLITVDHVWRDFVTPGIPSTGTHDVDKAEVRRYLKIQEGVRQNGVVFVDTLANLQAITDRTDYTGAVVSDDSVASNNGTYYWLTDEWIKLRDLDGTLTRLSQTNSDINDIVAVPQGGVGTLGADTFIMTFGANNDSAMSLDVGDGNGAVPLRSFSGVDAPANMIVTGRPYLIQNGTTERLVLAGFTEDTAQAQEAAAQAAISAAAAQQAAVDAQSIANFDAVYEALGVPLYSFLGEDVEPEDVTDWSDTFDLAAASGEVVIIPRGIFPFSRKITGFPASGGGFRGAGFSTLLQPTFSDDHYIEIGNGTDEFIAQYFSGFRIWPTVTQDAGFYAIHTRKTTQSTFDQLFIGSLRDLLANSLAHRISNGIRYDQFAEVVVSGQGQITVSGNGIAMSGGPAGQFGAEIEINERMRFLYCDVGVRIGGGCGGVYINSIDTSICRVGVQIDRTLESVVNREVFFGDKCVLDLSTDFNLNIEGSACHFVLLDNTWLSGNNDDMQTMMRIAPKADSITPVILMNGGIVKNCFADGIQNNGANLFINGTHFEDIGTSSNGGHAIFTPNAGAETRLDGCSFTRIGNATRGNAINVDPGVVGHAKNCSFSLTGQAAINDPSPNFIVRHNEGWVTEKVGQNAVNIGNTSVTFAHGMNGTPNVLVTPNSILGAAGAAYWAVSADATNITVSVNATLSGVWSFTWQGIVTP